MNEESLTSIQANPEKGLRHKAVKGVLWSLTGQWGRQAVAFIIFLMLSRLLGPEAFGLVALASVFTAFVQIFCDQGFGAAIVQRAELDREHLDTAFWTSVLLGSLLTVGGITLSGLVAAFFHEPRLTPIISWLSLNFFIISLSSTQEAILRRKLGFKKLAARSLVAITAGGIVGVVMAFFGFGVWSLVAQTLVDGMVRAVVLWRVSNWRPGLSFSKKHFKELFSFSVNIVGADVLNFVNRRSDDFLIGYFLGPTLLGYYTIAYRLLRIMTNLLTSVTTAVAFPTFSRLQKEPERMRHGFYMATQFTSLVAFPAFLGMSVLAPELTVVLFGAKWEPSIPVMRVLALIGILHAVFLFNSPLIKAAGKPSWALGLNFLNATANVVFFAIAVRWGIVAVAAAYVIRGYLLSPLPLWAVHRLIRIDLKTYFSQYAAPLFGSLAMVVVLLGAKGFLEDFISIYASLPAYIVLASVVYIVIILFIAPTLLRQALEIIRIAFPQLTWRKA